MEVRNERCKILSAELIDSYNYHGSWTEYTYKLKLKRKNGEVVEGKFDTSSEWARGHYTPAQLNGVTVKFFNDGDFHVDISDIKGLTELMQKQNRQGHL